MVGRRRGRKKSSGKEHPVGSGLGRAGDASGEAEHGSEHTVRPHECPSLVTHVLCVCTRGWSPGHRRTALHGHGCIPILLSPLLGINTPGDPHPSLQGQCGASRSQGQALPVPGAALHPNVPSCTGMYKPQAGTPSIPELLLVPPANGSALDRGCGSLGQPRRGLDRGSLIGGPHLLSHPCTPPSPGDPSHLSSPFPHKPKGFLPFPVFGDFPPQGVPGLCQSRQGWDWGDGDGMEWVELDG